MDVRQLAPNFGAEIRGFSPSGDVAEALFGTVRDLLHRHRVLVIRTDGLDPADQVAFSRRFGPLEIHAERRFILDGYPEVFCVGNKVVDGVARAAFSVGVEQWHCDSSYRAVPSAASLFYAHTVPPEGGATAFADASSAWRDLPPGTQRRIEGLMAVHDYEYFDMWLKVLNPDRRPFTDELRRVPADAAALGAHPSHHDGTFAAAMPRGDQPYRRTGSA